MGKKKNPKNNKTKACNYEPDQSTKSELLLAGKLLFSEKGLAGTTVRDLAAKANVNLCLISYHFGGKEGLYRACIEEFGRQRVQTVESLIGPVKSKEELSLRLRLLLEAMVSSILDNPELHRILLRECESGLQVAKEAFESTFLVLIQKMIQFFKLAQAQGFIPKEYDTFYLSTFIHGVVGHMLRIEPISQTYFNRSLKNPKHREHFIKNLHQILINGFISKDCQ